jgi:hypothetical protein
MTNYFNIFGNSLYITSLLLDAALYFCLASLFAIFCQYGLFNTSVINELAVSYLSVSSWYLDLLYDKCIHGLDAMTQFLIL